MEKNSNGKLLQSQFDWLSSLILPGGEFIMNNKTPDSTYKITPYFSNIACIALLEDSTKFALVKKYLLWYVSHLNKPDKYGVNGTIYDYWLRKNSELVSTMDYDSYDSYPATFLSLCLGYYRRSLDKRFFEINRQNIDLVTDSLIASIDTDYLTWAKPKYRVKYLMDNCEVYQGLADGAKLYEEVYNDIDNSQKLLNLAKKNYDAIESKMWIGDGYYYVIDSAGNGSKPNYKVWYADATSQLFPILCGLVKPESSRAKYIYDKFNSYQGNWFTSKKPDAFPNVYVCYVASLMKDFEKVFAFLDLCKKNYIDKGNIWPWYNVECSYFIRTYINSVS